MRRRKLGLRGIVIRASLDEMRAEGARWPEMQPIRDALRDDDDALIAEFDSRFWI